MNWMGTITLQRTRERSYLFAVLSLLCVMFFLTYLSFFDRGISSVLITQSGLLDISDYFLSPFPNSVYGVLFLLLFLLVHLFLRLKVPHADPFILPIVVLLSGIGFVMVFRFSPDMAIARNDAIQAVIGSEPGLKVTDNVLNLAQLGMRQMIFIVSGVLVMLAALYVFNKKTFAWLSSKKYIWVLLSIVLVIATLILGSEKNGRRLWLLGFQTVELVKLLMLFFIAGYIYERGRGIDAYKNTSLTIWSRHAGPFMAIWFFALVPLLIQRDIGPTFLIFVMFLLMFYYSGTPSRIIAAIVLAIIGITYISYIAGFPSIVHERFSMAIDPFTRSEGMSRAIWSISSGGIFGTGIGYGQSYRIPVVQSDYNFSAICEEMGLIGAISVVSAYILFAHRCYRISGVTTNLYKRTLVVGIALLITLQAFTIIAGNLGIIPMTGITLPFVSYGGSSMLVNFLMAGIVLRISGERDE
jgi:cell division protein FtsW (lipid II flippase)